MAFFTFNQCISYAGIFSIESFFDGYLAVILEQLRRRAVFYGNESNHILEEVVKEEFKTNGVEVRYLM